MIASSVTVFLLSFFTLFLLPASFITLSIFLTPFFPWFLPSFLSFHLSFLPHSFCSILSLPCIGTPFPSSPPFLPYYFLCHPSLPFLFFNPFLPSLGCFTEPIYLYVSQ
ncbi:hypothetical protein XENOCAPTIV_008965 [Xenoophorus captivus]|uniref:Uncharacterized protein n=1 Tax=Xenoophorus captivus TaxID=1517983 RepID=A0ABV0QW91_9TELE